MQLLLRWNTVAVLYHLFYTKVPIKVKGRVLFIFLKV